MEKATVGRVQGSLFSCFLKAVPLYLLPHHTMARAIYWLTRLRTPLKNPFLRWFIWHYKVNMKEALKPDLRAYPDFNSFFTRALRSGVREIASGNDEIACPVDGIVSQIGKIEGGRAFQAKGQSYSMLELFGGIRPATVPFRNGRFATLYLSPKDYHRIHMPLTGELREAIYLPGRLFSVAPYTVRVIPRLFARNERLIARFNTAAGAMAMVLVGALNVAAIETVWAGLITPPPGNRIQRWQYASKQVLIKKGDEMGRFNLGSTVILLFGSNVEWLEPIIPGRTARLGQAIGSFTRSI